ncbi:MAG: MFS transporter [Nostoc sp. NMS7]|uniref:MFS transporter n=1 Tax=Nostoc sp. NMS7 TaxID=2815391 RepID=UPI0025FF3DCF|nr:MFS transporter [Nostoc sp. NMS7]MBN3950376.1 MFS transporter [Nostoc sp. NMS7]
MARKKETSTKENALTPGARLWRDRNFNIFWAGQTFDAFGDSFAMIVMPLLVLEATGSIAQMGLVTGTIGVGNLISGIVSGAIVDHMDRRWLMIFCDIGRAIFYALIPLSWWFLGANIGLIYVVAGITAYLTTTFLITYNAAIPNIVDVDLTTDANGRLQSTVALAYVAGPMLAGLLSKRFDPSSAMGIASLSYILSALLMFCVRIRKAIMINPVTDISTKYAHLQEFLAGIRFLLNHPVLKSVTLILATFIFFSEATIDLCIFRLKYDLYQNNDAIGVVFGVGSFGALLGGLTAPTLRRRWGFGLCFLGSLTIQGITIASIGFAPTVVMIATLATFFTFGLTLRNVSSITLRQQVTPDQLLGRVSAAFWTLLTILGPVGTALTTAFAEKIGVPLVLVLIGVISVFVAMIGFFTPANTQCPEQVVPFSINGE